jgi:hypothetical protein
LRVALAAFAAILLTASLAACAPSGDEGSSAGPDAEVEAALRAYMPLLEQAYATQDPSILEPVAATKERLELEQQMRDLERQGQALVPELVELTVENVGAWNKVNAVVTTVETWHVKLNVAGTDRLIREDPEQVNRVVYQMKWDGETWRVMSRQLQQTLE